MRQRAFARITQAWPVLRRAAGSWTAVPAPPDCAAVGPVDTKKKELVSDFKNNGRELRAKGQPEPVRVHDFKIPELGKIAPYGVYDIAANHGWVSVDVDADTGAFAVESIPRWWYKLGTARYPGAGCLTITAD